jgi:hypothetical protein
MGEVRQVGIRTVSGSMQPNEGIFSLLVGKCNRAISHISDQRWNLESSHHL